MSSNQWGHEIRAAVSPAKMALGLVMGVFLTAGSGYGGFGVTPLAKVPTRRIEGTLLDVRRVELKSTRKGVEHIKYEMALKVEGEDLALHVGSLLFEGVLGGRIPPELAPDVTVVVTVQKEPVQPLSRGPYLSIVTLRTDTAEIISMAQATAADMQNRRVARILCFVSFLVTSLLGVCAYLFYWGPGADQYTHGPATARSDEPGRRGPAGAHSTPAPRGDRSAEAASSVQDAPPGPRAPTTRLTDRAAGAGSKYHDDTTRASDPGDLDLSLAKLRAWAPPPGVPPLPDDMLHEHLKLGDGRAAVVVSTRPLVVAAYTDELDCVAMLQLPAGFEHRYGLSAGSRLLTVNTYLYEPPAADLTPGPRTLGRYANFFPVIAELLSDDRERIEARKAAISGEEWARTEELGRAALRTRPEELRDGHPYASVVPAGLLRGNDALHSSLKVLVDRLFFYALPAAAGVVGGVLAYRAWGGPGALGGAPGGALGGLSLGLLLLRVLLPAGEAPTVSVRRLATIAGVGVAACAGLLSLPWIVARQEPASDAPASHATASESPRSDLPSPPRERAAPAPHAPLDAETALRRVQGSATERVATLEAWLERGLHRVAGARRDMLKAVGLEVDRASDDLLARSVADSISTQEALECVPLAPPATRRALLARLTERDPLFDSAEVARALLALEDDAEAGIEATLVRIGHARPGAARRLLLARGVSWAHGEEGKALLELLPVVRQRELLEAPEAELRAIGVRLMGARDSLDALDALPPLLRDASPIVRQEVVDRLQALGDPRAAVVLARALAVEPDEATRALLRRGLTRLAAEATAADALVSMLAHADADERLAGVAGIDAAEVVAGVRPLTGALRDADRRVAVAAVRALMALHGSRTSGVKAAVVGVAADVGRVALETRDAELKRLARKLYYDLRRRMPEQDLGR